MSRRRDLLVIGLVLLLLTGPAVANIAGPSHSATAGTTYQTNSGLTVTLGDDREVEASPFADDRTFASRDVEIESGGTSAVELSDQAFSGGTMAVRNIDADQNAITLRRDDLTNDVTVEGGATDVIVHNVSIDDGTTDLEVVADSPTNITIADLPDVGAIKAVDANGDVVASGEASTGTLELDTGSYELRIQEAADTLAIRDLTTQELITEDANGDPIDVRVEFFGNDGAVAIRNTTDGRIDMSGLPVDQRFAITVDAGDGYVTRQAIIPSLLKQETAWVLPDDSNISTVSPRFTIEDPTDQFNPERTEIVFKRPLERNGSTEFVAVAGDRIGLNGFDTTLEEDQRYRVTVTDPQTGATRELGEYTPTASELVTFTVEDVEFDSVSDVEGIEWTARYISNENDDNEIQFIYRDSQRVQQLEYRIVERGNEQNVLVNSTSGGNVTVTETVPPGDEDAVWVVEWTATREDGETLSASRPVSTSQFPVGPGLDSRWQTIISIIGLFAVAGLFGAVNPGIGGIAVASTGGMLFFIGWLPDSTGGLMVLLALFVAVLAFAGRKARGATA
jgi:hypothetical protein